MARVLAVTALLCQSFATIAFPVRRDAVALGTRPQFASRRQFSTELEGSRFSSLILDKETAIYQSKQQQAGIDIPFFAPNSSSFIPKNSTTFQNKLNQAFTLNFIDGTHLEGFWANDIVRLGDFDVTTNFGAVTFCDSSGFNGIDGIVGLGPPLLPTTKNSGIISNSVPKPLFFDLTSGGSRKRAFSFVASIDRAELHLGGYDPAAITGDMYLIPTIDTTRYYLRATSLKYGSQELLRFAPASTSAMFMSASIDSGASCLIMPDSSAKGKLMGSPYQKWMDIVKNPDFPAVRTSFFVTLGGRSFEIPFDHWYTPSLNQSCVSAAPGSFSSLILGDVFFMRHLALFDLRYYPSQIFIGIALRNPDYDLLSFEDPSVSMDDGAGAAPATPLANASALPAGYELPAATDRLGLYNQLQTQYFARVSVGTPPQDLAVIVDTGSSIFAVFSRCIAGQPSSYNSPDAAKCTFGGKAAAAKLWYEREASVSVLAMSAGGVGLLGAVGSLMARRRRGADAAADGAAVAGDGRGGYQPVA